MEPVRQTDAVQQPSCPFLRQTAAQAQDVDRALHHVLERRAMREQVEALEHHPHSLADLSMDPMPFRRGRDPIGGEPQAVDRDPARLEPLQAIQAAEERALAAARWPDDGGHLALSDRQAHAPEDLDRTVPLDQINHFDHANTPPFSPLEPSRRSDHRENHESGRLINR